MWKGIKINVVIQNLFFASVFSKKVEHILELSLLINKT